MLDRSTKGAWNLRIRDDGSQQRICVRDGREFIQLRHRSPAAAASWCEDGADEVVVQYTCRGNGYGRTSIRREGNGAGPDPEPGHRRRHAVLVQRRGAAQRQLLTAFGLAERALRLPSARAMADAQREAVVLLSGGLDSMVAAAHRARARLRAQRADDRLQPAPPPRDRGRARRSPRHSARRGTSSCRSTCGSSAARR